MFIIFSNENCEKKISLFSKWVEMSNALAGSVLLGAGSEHLLANLLKSTWQLMRFVSPYICPLRQTSTAEHQPMRFSVGKQCNL